jgi:hypothetical protein
VIILPLAEEDTTNEEVGHLIEELHASGRWPILVYNLGYTMKGNLYTEIQKDGSYIILTSGPCVLWKSRVTKFRLQLRELINGKNTKQSWNPRAKFVVPVMSNCTQFDNKNLSSSILALLWIYEVTNVAVIFLNTNESAGNDLKKKHN